MREVAFDVIADIAWSLLLGVLVAVGPHTSHSRVVPAVVGGTLVAIAVFFYRRWFIASRSGGASVEAESGTAPSVSALGWLCIAACAAAFLPTLFWLGEEYTKSVWRNGHGLFLPLIVYGLARYRLRRTPALPVTSSAWGLPLVVAGAALALVESATHIGFAGATGLVLALPGLSLLLFGTAVTRAIALPLALGIFLLPVPESLVDPLALPTVSAMLAEPMLRFFDVPVLRDETSLVLPVSSFGVSANCSGLSTFYSALLVAVVLGAFTESWTKRVLLVALAWPITVLVNGFRVTFLVGSSNAIGFDWFLSPVHGMSGIISFWVTIAIMCAIGWREFRRVALP